MKHLIRMIVVFILTLPFAYYSIKPEKDLINTLYNVSGILFSIGLGLIVTLDLSQVRNDKLLKGIRKNIRIVRNTFIIYFVINTAFYILSFYLIHPISVFGFEYYYGIFVCLTCIYTIMYFVYNFLEIQQLKNDITDAVNNSQS